MELPLDVAPPVAQALAAGAPVVALESTIVAHGFAFPASLDLAREMEAAVAAGGATPATIAVLGGRVHIGLDAAALERLAVHGPRFAKAGAADLAVHLARGGDAATTVSATAVLAAHAGIRVFATGGIGGVHRGDSGDVSHDLAALAATPIAVVSAGAKAILDLPRTVEALETLGALVIGLGTDELPAFYTRRSGVRLDHHVDDIASVAAICRLRWDALGQGGVLVCNPIPAAAELDAGAIDQAIADALTAAADAKVAGKRLTPFLLSHLARATGGAAVAANRALALHNAEVGARLAVALAT